MDKVFNVEAPSIVFADEDRVTSIALPKDVSEEFLLKVIGLLSNPSSKGEGE